MTDSGKTLNGKKLNYEITENGYAIYLEDKELLTWRNPGGKIEADECEALAKARIGSIAFEPEVTE